ncbi:hemagglutinin repeat-containing protein [Pseudomonas sp. SDO55104_S430]
MVKNREHFWGMPKRGLAFLLANVMFWQPVWAQAEGIVVANPGTSLGQAGNGVPIVNIATPNGSGLSHNQFVDYNVGNSGVILNNVAGQTGTTQLGGIIVGNPNLTNGVAAQTILNEVVGGSPSQLRGYTEVAGQSARVIVANPYGISCNGCGFINTPRVTLTTGKPVLDGSGRVDRFQVDQGSVSIDGAGLNANNVDSFEIITRSAKINAEIQAKNLTIIAGRNDVNAQTLSATARVDDGSAKPQLAIDSSALGGMYAGAIKLVGTEAGVGVKLAGNLAASGGDIQIDANGHLSLAQTAATNAVNVKAASLDAQGPVYGSAVNVQTQGNLAVQQSVAARDSISLSAGGQLSNNGIIEAGVNADNSRNGNGDAVLSAQNLNNTGSVVASRNLTVTAAQTLTNQGGTLSGRQNSLVTATTLDNRNKGAVSGDTSLQLNATQILNTQGLLSSNGNLTATVGHLNNHDGEVSSAGSTRISGTSLDNSDGQVTGDVALNIGLIGTLNNQNGVLGSGRSVNITAASLDNSHDGSLVSDGSLSASIAGLFDNQNGDLSAKGAVDVQSATLDNRNGNITGKDRLTLRGDSLDNRAGQLRASKDLQLTISQIDNRGGGTLDGKAAVTVNGTQLDNRGGILTAKGPLRLQATGVDNSGGRIFTEGDLTTKVAQFTNQQGELTALGMLTHTGQTFDNRSGGLVASAKALTLTVDDIDNRGGEISSAVDVSLHGQSLNNSDSGKVLGTTTLGLTVAHIINQTKGLLRSEQGTTLVGQSLENSGGNLVSLQGLNIRLDNALSNVEGLISSEGKLSVQANSFDNTRGELSSAGLLALTTSGALINQSGSLTTDSGLTLTSQSLDNSLGGAISGKLATAITTGALDNTAGGSLISGDTLDLNATQVSNGANSQIASEKALTALVTGFDQQGGRLFSKTSLSLDLNQGQLNNQSGVINAPLLVLKNLKDVNNTGGEISSAQAFTLDAHNVDNSNGKLISNQGVTLRIEQLLASIKGLISAQSLDIHSTRLDNSDGLISSRDALDLTLDGQFVNHGGVLIADGDLKLGADSVDNSNGYIAGKADVVANVATLDNQQGELVATGALTLTGTRLDNRNGGLVGSNNTLQLNVDSVDNRAGELSSQSDVNLVGNRLDNSDGGKVVALDALTLTVAEVLNRTKGLLSGKTDLNLIGHSLDSAGGSLLSQKNLNIGLSGDLDNTQGLISAEGSLDVTAASLTNNLGGLSAAGPLTLTTTGVVLNQSGLIVTDAGLMLNSASINNSNGNISGKGAVVVNTGSLDNSLNGRLNSGDTLDLSATQVTNQSGGRIASTGAMNANVTGLDQQGGQMFSNTSLTLDLNQGQLNNQNGLISAPLLMLKNLSDVNNTGGEISSAQAFTLAARNMESSNGKLLSNQAVTLRIEQALTNVKGLIAAAALDVKAASLDNSGGTLTSRADVSLNLEGMLTNQDEGLISANDGLTISSNGLNNQSGVLLGSAIAIDFGAATADLNNDAGLITTTGQLSLKHLRDLSNRGGEISSSQSFDINARNLDSSAGKLISSNLLNVNAGKVLNQNGLISGSQGLVVTADSLDNRNSGTLSSNNGSLDVTLSGELLNSTAGALASLKTLNVNATNLDNSSGGVLSSGGAQTLTLSGTLNNAAGGLIDSGATLAMQAISLGNAGGTINAIGDVRFTGTTLDNTGGTYISNGAVTLDLLGALVNTNGKLASGGPLLLQRSTQVNNQGGQLASQDLMTLLTGGLDNRNHGTIAANDQLTITTPGTVQNSADGLIYSQNGELQLQADSFTNAKGTLQSQGALTLKTVGDIDNQSGRILAKNGDLSIDAGHLDNRGGVLAALQGAFAARLTGVLRNGYDLNNNHQGGVIQAQRLNLNALGGFDNYGGRISAQSGDAIIATSDFDNRNGGLYAKGKVNVTGNNFDNSGDNDGQIAGQQIDLTLTGALNNRLGIIESDTTLAIKAASLDNQTGQLRALGTAGKTSFQIGGLFDNRNGTLETANLDLTLGAGSFLNAGGSLLHVGTGTFDISTNNVINAGGGIVTRGALTISTNSWTNTSVIQAGRLSVNVNNFTQTASGQLLGSTSFVGSGVNWYNEGLIASDGTLNFGLSGTYWGGGRVSSQGNLGLNAAQVNLNTVNSSIAGGGDTTLNVGGQLYNAGRLTSKNALIINAGGVSNSGTTAAGADLTLTTGNLANAGGLIFSGRNMSLRVADFSNSYANVYSLGNLTIDRNGSGALANSIINRSSSLQSDGSMFLAASTIQNIRDVLTVNNAGIYTARIGEITCIEGVNAGDCSGKQNHVWEIVQREKLEVTAASAASSITAGGNLSLNGGNLLNQSSTIATAGNFNATLVNLTNSGVETGDTETTRIFRSQRTSNAGGWYSAAEAFTDQYWYESSGYNANDLSGIQGGMANFIGMTEAELPELGSTRKIAGGDQSYAAVIQAAGAVNINAQNTIDNSVVRPGYSYIGSGPRTGTGAAGSQFSTRITLNQQLPPDLAQQQVNPLALPGFALPTGQNGLFRLSAQEGSAPATTGPQSWNMGGASINPTQRQQTLPGFQPRDILPTNNASASASNVNLNTADRQGQQQGAGASAIDVSVPTGDASDSSLPGRSTAFTINRVQGVPASTGQSKPQKYLIETNPVLTDLKQFMSSDYLLSNLGYDPDQSAKRLGDGFYEQTLIQQAVVARTGQRFIDGQTSNDGLFKYLMDNALTSKNELNLSVGVSLTSEQVAALTHDIVWMETAEVNGEQVLVPVLYLANANNRLAANGALIQGSDVTLIAGKDLNNAGTLKASNNLSASAGNDLVNSGLVEAGNRLDLLAGNNLINKSGGVIAGKDVSLTTTNGDVINERTVTTHESSSGYRTERTDFVDSAARIEAANNLTINAGRDINNNGGVLKSGADTTITAGRDVNLVSAEQVVSGQRGLYTNESIKQYGSIVDTGQDLKVNAGRDITAIASQIDAKRDVSMSAIGDLTLASAADEEHSYNKTRKVTSQEDHVSQVSTSVTAGGSVALSAGKDLALIASRVSAGDEAYLYAGSDLNLESAENTDYSYYSKTKTSHSGLSSSQKTRIDSSSSTTQQGSSISADSVVVHAGKDISVVASDIASTNSTSLIAGRNVAIDGATETFEESHSTSKKKSGLLSSGGIGFTLGSASNQNTSTSSFETNRASTVGSVLGTVNIEAGKDLSIKGSDVIAGKDIRLVGQNVSILAAETNNRSEQTSKSKSSGLTLALSGTVGSAVDSAYQTTKQAREEDDSRLAALQGVKAGLTGVQAWQAAQQGGGMTDDNAGQFVGISVSLGSQKSSSKQTQEQTVSQGSSLTSGNNLTIIAAGNGIPGADGDIRIQGSKLQAGNEMLLAAERDIRLEAAANTQKLDGKNSSSGGAIGASIGVGPNGGGLSIFANANKGTGSEKGNGTTWTETTLDAGKQVSLISGRDTTLKGAQVSADQIIANVGRDLTLQSLQDSDDYKSKQTNVSGGASVAIIGTGGSANLSVSKSTIDSKYLSVQEQTGLFSGKGGYQVNVGNHTQLDGSVIASTADADKNRLSTGTLGWSDIKNKAEYTSSLQSASVSSGSNGTDGFTSNMPSGMLIAFNHGDSASGNTSSAISNGTLEIRDPAKQQQDVATLSRDVEHANDSISPIFDKEKEQNRLRQVQLIGDIGTQVSDIVRTQGQLEADKAAREELARQGNQNPTLAQVQEAKAYKDVMKKYGTGGDYQRAVQAVSAALQGLAGGDIGSALAGASAPYLANIIKKSTEGNDTARIMAQAVLGAIVAQTQGNSAAAGAAGAVTGELIAAQLYPNTKREDLTEAQKQTISALSTLAAGFVGGAVDGDLGGAVAGAQSGRNAVENNELGSRVYADKLYREYATQSCSGLPADVCRANYGKKIGDESHLGTVSAIGGVVAGGILFGPELLAACGVNLAACTELGITAVEVSFGSAAAGGTALGVGGFGSLAAKEVGATADAAAAVRNAEGSKEIIKLPVPTDLPTNIHMGQQGKHIKGHNNFEEGRSYFNDGVDPAELLGGVHSGKYPVVGVGARGNPIVDFGRPIGVDGRTGQSVTRGQIHYGKNGAHIVPDARN